MSQVNIRVYDATEGSAFVLITRPDGTTYETVMDAEIVRILAQNENANQKGYSFSVITPIATI